jgi:hypothetical protein
MFGAQDEETVDTTAAFLNITGRAAWSAPVGKGNVSNTAASSE